MNHRGDFFDHLEIFIRKLPGKEQLARAVEILWGNFILGFEIFEMPGIDHFWMGGRREPVLENQMTPYPVFE